jgi:D-alanine-D-alanine ligase
MGGPSAEREVSLRSGAAVTAGLRAAGYTVTLVDVRDARVDAPDGVEAVFLALHGAFGEDGTVQAILDGLGVPYTGSGARASRAAFDKAVSKRVLVEHAIRTPEYQVLRNGDARRLALPAVVKPTCQGSTIGVHRVMDDGAWDEAVRDARRYGPEVLAERFLPGREFTVGIVDLEALPVVEIVAPGGWYSYEAKYTKGETRYLAPAPVSEGLARECREMALAAFRALGCRGLGRVDLRCDGDGLPHVLELNSIPGFTETSLLPKAAAVAGLAFPELCGRIMELAECNDVV